MDKAGGILGVAKKRELVAAGLTVVEQSRLEALKRLYEATRVWRNGMIDRRHPGMTIGENLEWQHQQMQLAYTLRDTVDELEAMEK